MEQQESKAWGYWAIPIVVIAALGAALYYGRKQQEKPPAPAQAAAPAPAPVSTAPAIQHPVQQAPAPEPLPPLAESDSTLQQKLADLFGPELKAWLVPESIVRRVVATIDNLPRKKIALQLWPVKPTPGTLLTVAEGEEAVLSTENFARYAPLMQLVQGADMARVAATYRSLYPLFQQAYEDLGYPDGYFNDRLVAVIDHLLETPEISSPLRLRQPGVFYQFADAALEERSAGQKLLIRMGNQNTVIIKNQLRQLRAEISRPGEPTP